MGNTGHSFRPTLTIPSFLEPEISTGKVKSLCFQSYSNYLTKHPRVEHSPQCQDGADEPEFLIITTTSISRIKNL